MASRAPRRSNRRRRFRHRSTDPSRAGSPSSSRVRRAVELGAPRPGRRPADRRHPRLGRPARPARLGWATARSLADLALLVIRTTPYWGRGLLVNPGARPDAGHLTARVYAEPLPAFAVEVARWFAHRRPGVSGVAAKRVAVPSASSVAGDRTHRVRVGLSLPQAAPATLPGLPLRGAEAPIDRDPSARRLMLATRRIARERGPR
jgi:hypothetical protein